MKKTAEVWVGLKSNLCASDRLRYSISRKVAIQRLATLGLAVTGIGGDVCSSAVEPTAATVFVQKV